MSDRVGDMGVAVWIALGRAHQGGVTNLAGQWFDCGNPVPGYLADALDRLTSSGQLALAVPDSESCGARRVTVTDTGRARYVTLSQVHNSPGSGRPAAETAPGGRPDTTAPVGPAGRAGDAAGGDLQRGTLGAGQVVINPGVHRDRPRPTDLPVPAPLFATKTPAGRQLSNPAPLPAPGGQPDPSPQAGNSGDGPLRWARCPDDGHLHLLRPAEVVVGVTGGQAEALCGRPLPAEGLTLARGSAGALCLTCLAGIIPHQQPTHPVLTTPGGC